MPLRLPSHFSSHAVLQRGRPHRFHGTDAPWTRVTVSVAGRPESATGVAGADGVWAVELPTLPDGGPYRVRVEGTMAVELEDVVVGEVWLASGQSNMEWGLASADGPAPEVPAGVARGIRLLAVPKRTAFEPEVDTGARWQVANPMTMASFSAVALHFGARLARELGCPVGLIGASWGGTRVEAWASVDALRAVMDVDRELQAMPRTPEELEEKLKAHRLAVTAWEAAALPADPGNRGEALGWQGGGFDDGAWAEMDLPCFWQARGLAHNGVVWFRRTVPIPEAWVGRDLELSLGPVDDFDHTYAEGVLVGSHPKGTPAAYQIPRVYRVPARCVTRAAVTVAVRVFDHFGQGGLPGGPGAFELRLAEGAEAPVLIAGVWKYAVEHALPSVSSSVFSTQPPPPGMEPQHRPGALYNAMIAPLTGYALRGAIWYQGESNAGDAGRYRDRFTSLIRDWRTRWGLGDFPFLFVQLAAWTGGGTWPLLREAQAATLTEPATGMALALDVGDPTDIHPRDKKTVGERLSRLALARVYRVPEVDRGPYRKHVEIAGGEVVVRWVSASGLRTTDGEAPKGFEVAGVDRVFHPAEAWIEGEAVVLASAAVSRPVAVRYAFRDYLVVNLVNAAGLPAEPFRTDGW